MSGRAAEAAVHCLGCDIHCEKETMFDLSFFLTISCLCTRTIFLFRILFRPLKRFFFLGGGDVLVLPTPPWLPANPAG